MKKENIPYYDYIVPGSGWKQSEFISNAMVEAPELKQFFCPRCTTRYPHMTHGDIVKCSCRLIMQRLQDTMDIWEDENTPQTTYNNT